MANFFDNPLLGAGRGLVALRVLCGAQCAERKREDAENPELILHLVSPDD